MTNQATASSGSCASASASASRRYRDCAGHRRSYDRPGTDCGGAASIGCWFRGPSGSLQPPHAPGVKAPVELAEKGHGADGRRSGGLEHLQFRPGTRRGPLQRRPHPRRVCRPDDHLRRQPGPRPQLDQRLPAHSSRERRRGHGVLTNVRGSSRRSSAPSQSHWQSSRSAWS